MLSLANTFIQVTSLAGSHVQVASSLVSVPGTPTAVSTATAAYTAYPSPYGSPAPVPAGSVPPVVADPYAQTAVAAPPGGTVQVAGAPVGAPPAGQPTGVPGNWKYSITVGVKFILCTKC